MSKKARVLKEPSPHLGVALHVAESDAHTAAQVRETFRGRISERRGVEVRPERFDGIKLGGIGREPFHAQPATVLGERRAGEAAAVGGEAIPDEENPTPPMTPERVQEAHDVGTLDASATEGQEPSQALTRGRGKHRANPREPLPVERFAQAGRLAFGGPGGPDRGPLREPALVQKPQPSFQLAGFFLTWGQRTWIQRAIAASSRS